MDEKYSEEFDDIKDNASNEEKSNASNEEKSLSCNDDGYDLSDEVDNLVNTELFD